MFHDYHHFEQGDDLGIEAGGKTLETALENAALAVFAALVHPATVIPEREVRLEFEAADPAAALVTWLRLLLGQASLRGLVFCAFQLERQGDRWAGLAWGMPWQPGSPRAARILQADPVEPRMAHSDRGWRVAGRLRLSA